MLYVYTYIPCIIERIENNHPNALNNKFLFVPNDNYTTGNVDNDNDLVICDGSAEQVHSGAKCRLSAR
jgi:hypothetical protein